MWTTTKRAARQQDDTPQAADEKEWSAVSRSRSRRSTVLASGAQADEKTSLGEPRELHAWRIVADFIPSNRAVALACQYAGLSHWGHIVFDADDRGQQQQAFGLPEFEPAKRRDLVCLVACVLETVFSWRARKNDRVC